MATVTSDERSDESVVDSAGAGADSSVAEPPPHGASGSRRRWWGGSRPRWSVVAAGVAGVLALYYLVTFFQVVQTGRSHGAEPADAIVVLGAAQYDGRPSPQLAARLDHVLTLWDDGVAPRVVVTGGKQPADRFTESDASRSYLVDRGVPDDAILAEDAGRTTYESLQGVVDLLAAEGVDEVVLVTDPYHSLRSRLIAEELGLEADVASTPTSVVQGWTAFRRQIWEAGGVALGRLVGFERLSGLTG